MVNLEEHFKCPKSSLKWVWVKKVEHGFLPDERVALYEDVFKNSWHNLPWGPERIEQLVKEGKVIPCVVDTIYLRDHSRYGYFFTEGAEKEWQDVLENRYKAYDFSEAD